MTSLIRQAVRIPRAFALRSATAQPHRFASSSYGNEQSGHEQGTHEKNPKQHLEHPGPETPASKDQSQGSSQSSSKSGGGSPKIQTPESAAEKENPEVRKHNEEMAQRADRSVNQLSEKDNKVDKQFWKGDVGDMKGNKE